ncbi:GAF domain-containing protein [Thalassotalea sp. M1531]|uniref:histidine kinase n=1 Tax=Thalassotalea algicola TaxID=2716224 RepID=A0A7Y0LAY6_9GAMM|nr:GAF domain-containing sensor histidine kinase [Thalassotalea algicola]NMP31213.1 GAF domain-containing protein [Thalassotalea algicola]
MTANISTLNQLPIDEQLSYWQRASQLEEGRSEVLRLVASGKSIEYILKTLCQKAQLYSPDMLCSVLSLNLEKKTLHPMASVSLPEFYCQALDGVQIGLGIGSCGTSAFTKERVIVEDINTHPYWVQFKGLALEAGLQACWSEPIVGRDGRVFGTFAMYYQYPNTPSDEDLKFIELSANLAAVVFDNDLNRQQFLDANNKLNMTIDQRTQQLEQANAELAQLIKQKEQLHINQINAEKMLTTNALLCGFAHEVSTPIGNALVAVSTVQEKLEKLQQAFGSGKLSRRLFEKQIDQIAQLVSLNKRSLDNAGALLGRFKSIEAGQEQYPIESVDLKALMKDVATSVKGVLGRHLLVIDVDAISLSCAKESLWQIFYQLIENSVIHGFKDGQTGTIHITAVKKHGEVVINYQDDGVGLDDEHSAKIFEPFYTTQRNKNNIGLGLSTVGNLLASVLNGRIQLMQSPVGIRFEIVLPLNPNSLE